MKNSPEYTDLLHVTSGNVEGTWDDHDYGVNDAGINLPDKAERQRLYLDFLGVPEGDDRRVREGVYHAWSVDSPGGGVVRVLFLDTRTFRSTHFVPSVGGIKGLPLNAVIASFTRLLVKLTGSGSRFTGDVLGQAQWDWIGESEQVANNFRCPFAHRSPLSPLQRKSCTSPLPPPPSSTPSSYPPFSSSPRIPS